MRRLFRPRFVFAAALLLAASLSAHEVKAQTVGPHDVLISEFRLAGPAGDSDEYIELYCNRDTDCDISNYAIRAHDPNFGDFDTTFPDGTVLPARGNLLIGDTTEYSLDTYAQLDFDVAAGFDYFIDNEGLQLLDDTATVVIDSVGFTGGGNEATYVEGTGLQRATDTRPADQYAYVRKMGTATGGRPQDTDNNANDFTLVSVTGAPHPGITAPPVLGAPGPQGLNAPATFDNTKITGTLVEPNAAQGASPNRVRSGSGNSGTLSIRRSFTNNTGQTIDYLAFRVIDITTLNSPVTLSSQAQLRLVTSGDAETFTNSQGRTVVIKGTVLEFDSGEKEPNQPNGGGLNTSANVNVGTGIAPGETVDVQFLLNVVQSGNFRFYVNVEATTSDVVGASPIMGSPAVAGGTLATGRSRSAALGSISAPRHLVSVNRKPSSIGTPVHRPTVNRAAPVLKKTSAVAPKAGVALISVTPVVSLKR